MIFIFLFQLYSLVGYSTIHEKCENDVEIRELGTMKSSPTGP